jgi:hypothetical protein
MNKLFILAALLLPCVAQGETWVCTSANVEDEDSLTYLRTFSRQDTGFSTALTTPMRPDKNPETLESEMLNILSETEEMLALVHVETWVGTEVSIYLINKSTGAYVIDTVHSMVDTDRAEGQCVKV